MNVKDAINLELLKRDLLPLTEEQTRCLADVARLEETVGMLQDLRDRCGVQLPLPRGETVGGPFRTLEEACAAASKLARAHLVATVDEMATDESRASGYGEEFYVTAFDGAEAAVALADTARWSACWMRGTPLS